MCGHGVTVDAAVDTGLLVSGCTHVLSRSVLPGLVMLLWNGGMLGGRVDCLGGCLWCAQFRIGLLYSEHRFVLR
jgi:hypothetical protein